MHNEAVEDNHNGATTNNNQSSSFQLAGQNSYSHELHGSPEAVIMNDNANGVDS